MALAIAFFIAFLLNAVVTWLYIARTTLIVTTTQIALAF
jgi:hypothetical protein